ncbi:MAG: acyl-CoA dehydrogenase family protein [Burkholderiaceae bacterium]
MNRDNPLLSGHDEPAQRLIGQAIALARELVEPQAAQWEHERRLDRAALREAAAAGLTSIQVPRALGGQGAGFRCKAAVAAMLAKADFGFAMSLVNTHNVAAKVANEGSPAMVDRFLASLISTDRLGSTALTEPDAGSDFAAIATRATPTTDGGWRIDGRKAWITNAAESDVLVVYAKTGAGEGGNAIASFLVDGRRDGFRRLPAAVLCGQHTIGTGGFELEHYQAAGDELLAGAGQGFKAALGSINGARIYIAAMCCAMLERALEIAHEFGLTRRSFGVPLMAHQGWRWRLAEASAELAAGWALVDGAARALEQSSSVMVAAAQAKIFATRMAERHLPAMQHALGAAGLDDSLPLGRHLIGVQVAGFVDGSTEMLLERVLAASRSSAGA